MTTPGLTSIRALMITIGAATGAVGVRKAETADNTAKFKGDSP
jgi:hypothetical protein